MQFHARQDFEDAEDGAGCKKVFAVGEVNECPRAAVGYVGRVLTLGSDERQPAKWDMMLILRLGAVFRALKGTGRRRFHFLRLRGGIPPRLLQILLCGNVAGEPTSFCGETTVLRSASLQGAAASCATQHSRGESAQDSTRSLGEATRPS